MTAIPGRGESDFAVGGRLIDGPSRTRRASRGFVRYLIAIGIGVAGTLAWQSHGEAVKRTIAANAPQLGWSPEAQQTIAGWMRELGWTKPQLASEKPSLLRKPRLRRSRQTPGKLARRRQRPLHRQRRKRRRIRNRPRPLLSSRCSKWRRISLLSIKPSNISPPVKTGWRVTSRRCKPLTRRSWRRSRRRHRQPPRPSRTSMCRRRRRRSRCADR